MKKYFLAMSMALWAFGAQAAQKTCALTALASVDLFIDQDGLYVPVTINDQARWLILGTEYPLSHLFPEQAGELKLPIQTSSAEGGFGLRASEKVVSQLSAIDELTIGGLRLPQKDWIVSPRPGTPKSIEGRAVIGGLEMDILWRYDFQLDFALKKLVLYSQEHCSGQEVQWTNRYGRLPVNVAEMGNLYFPVDINGKKIEATFATTESITFMNATVARRVFGFDANASGLETVTAATGELFPIFRAENVSAADLRFSNVRMVVRPETEGRCKLSSVGRPSGAIGFNGCYGIYPLRLGRPEMQRLQWWYFATREGVVYFSDASPPQ